MNVEEILEKINVWKNERYFDHYYHSGVFHKKTLELLKLDNLKDLEVYLLKLKPSNQKDLGSDLEYLQLKKEERELNIICNKNKENFSIWSSERLEKESNYKALLSDNQERQKPFIDISNTDKKLSNTYQETFSFFFPRSIEDVDLTDFDQFVLFMREGKIREWHVRKLDNNWNSLVTKALAFPTYYRLKCIIPDDYQILSAYLLRLQNALKLNSYRIDEKGRVHLDLKNSIMATLTITKLPIETKFNEFELGEVKQTLPVSNSGYDNNFYVLSDLTLYFEGYHLHFSFEAFAVLANGFDTNFNASSKVRDDKKEIWG